MTVTVDSFRVSFTEFANKVTYPDGDANFYLTYALLALDPARWGNLLDIGVQLFIAHNLALEFNAKRAAALGQNPGFIVGSVSSGSVDKVSYSRNLTGVMNTKHGHWNLTIYGLRYIRMVGMIGAGPLQVGAPNGDPGTGAWPGPIGSIVPGW